MNSLKKPIFWAYMVWLLYVFFQGVFDWGFNPTLAGMAKALFGIFLLSAFLFIAAVFVIVLRHPISSNNYFLSFSPYLTGFIGLSQICVGSLSLYSLLDALPAVLKVADTPWKLYMNVSGAIQLPVGLLVFIFSMFQLILNRKSKQL